MRKRTGSLGAKKVREAGLSLVLVILFANVAAYAQSDALAEAPSSSPRDFLQVNDRLYFTADDGIHGRELWVYDESTGCSLAMDVLPGPESGQPVCRDVHGDFLYFMARNAKGGWDLWQWNDQTRQALRLYSNTHQEYQADPHVHMRTSDSPVLFFTLCDESRAWNIYTQKAGESELRRVTDFPPENDVAHSSRGIVLSNGVDVFLSNGYVWRSDGTPEGTMRYFRSGLGRSANTWLQPLGDRAILKLKDNEHGLELWVTDGTEQGTRLLHDICRGPEDAVVGQNGRLGNLLFFGANDGLTGLELWCTDGTPEGTRFFKDINPGRGSSDPHYFKATETLLFFGADDGRHGIELWCTDGTTEGTRLVKDIDPGLASSSPYHLAAVGSLMCFGATTPVHGDALWVSDGTASGTRLFADVVPGNSPEGPAQLTALNGKLVLTYTEPLHGEELWAANIASGDIRLLADINVPIVNPSAEPAFLTAQGDVLYFVAHDLAHGKELWSSQGTDASTHLVYDIHPGPADSSPEQLTVGDSVLYFTATTYETGRELWSTHSAGQGVLLLADISPGPNDATPRNLTPVGHGLYFTAQSGSSNRRLWFSDGTPAGTDAVQGFDAHGKQTQFQRLFAHAGQAYIYVQSNTGLALYSLARDMASSSPLLEIQAGQPAPRLRDSHQERVALEHLLYWMYPPEGQEDTVPVEFDGEQYFVVHTTLYGAELWRTDAPTSGVVLVCDAFPGAAGSCPRQLTPYKGRLHFVADHPSFGQVLWSTDGTPLGTEVVRPTRADSILPPVPAMTLAPLGDLLVMVGRDAANSVDYSAPPRLYVLRRNENLTSFDVIPSLPDPPGGLNAAQLTHTPSRVFFTADDSRHGNELWTLDAQRKSTLVKDILEPGDLKPLRK